jgi:hypothetical protein
MPQKTIWGSDQQTINRRTRHKLLLKRDLMPPARMPIEATRPADEAITLRFSRLTK